MLEDEILACPICDNKINVKVNRVTRLAKDTTYYVIEDCPSCKTSANKLEKMLRLGKPKPKMERSYIKVDPRG